MGLRFAAREEAPFHAPSDDVDPLRRPRATLLPLFRTSPPLRLKRMESPSSQPLFWTERMLRPRNMASASSETFRACVRSSSVSSSLQRGFL
jgi:hypothetical protein